MIRSKRLGVAIRLSVYLTGRSPSKKSGLFFLPTKSTLQFIHNMILLPKAATVRQFRKDRGLIGDLADLLIWLESGARHYSQFRKFPNITNPKTLNDWVNRYKLTLNKKTAMKLTDKLQAATFVESKTTRVKTLAKRQIQAFGEIPLGQDCVVKTNHDSGGILKEPNAEQFKELIKRSKVIYGLRTGEIVYWNHEPKIFIERRLKSEPGILNVKVFCYFGQPMGVFFTLDEGDSISEILMDPSLQIRKKGLNPNPPICDLVVDFDQLELDAICNELCSELEFVRLDLMRVGGHFYFGEFTFFPLAGLHKGEGIGFLGEQWAKMRQATA